MLHVFSLYQFTVNMGHNKRIIIIKSMSDANRNFRKVALFDPIIIRINKILYLDEKS